MAKLYKKHYNCQRLVNSLDADGDKPAFFIVCSKLRGPGKTFSFSELLIEKFLEEGKKFILLTRNMGDLGNVASGILDGFLQERHKDMSVSEKIQMKGVFSKIYLNKGTGDDKATEECGYVIPIRAADQIKKISSMFYDAWCFYFDEFQPMNRATYLKDEVDLLYNIYKSIARGEGSAVRYMPVYMASNTITLGNPYFTAFGLNRAIQSNTKFYKGHGVIFENCDVEGLKELHENSAIDKALRAHKERKGDNMWINDADSLVCKPDNWGRGDYICTLKYGDESIGVLKYQNGYTYLSRKVDQQCSNIYSLTLDDNTLNIPLLRTRGNYLYVLRDYFYKGLIRVQDTNLQNILMDIFG